MRTHSFCCVLASVLVSMGTTYCGREKNKEPLENPSVYGTWLLSGSQKIGEVLIDTDVTFVFQTTKLKIETAKVTLIDECVAGEIRESYSAEVVVEITSDSIVLSKPLSVAATDTKIACAGASFDNSSNQKYLIKEALLHVKITGGGNDTVLSRVSE